jgi:glyoxylase-like metal-dependent hydrolase (beta-lactamase superfamily II)
MASSLETYTKSSSERALFSVTSLIVGTKSAILIDPPFLIPDALEVISWIKKTTDKDLHAVFVTHHHPDHYFSANPILEAFPSAAFYAAPYVCAGIDREYEEKVKYWPKVFGKENVPEMPRKPTPYAYSFIILDGNPTSPIMLLGPVQGDTVDHTLFWLPSEKTIITGDAIYGRSTHVW